MDVVPAGAADATHEAQLSLRQFEHAHVAHLLRRQFAFEMRGGGGSGSK
jgi:hypothetical protein